MQGRRVCHVQEKGKVMNQIRNKIEIHKSICDKSHETYKAKNSDSMTKWCRDESEPRLSAIQGLCKELKCSADWLIFGKQ